MQPLVNRTCDHLPHGGSIPGAICRRRSIANMAAQAGEHHGSRNVYGGYQIKRLARLFARASSRAPPPAEAGGLGCRPSRHPATDCRPAATFPVAAAPFRGNAVHPERGIRGHHRYFSHHAPAGVHDHAGTRAAASGISPAPVYESRTPVMITSQAL